MTLPSPDDLTSLVLRVDFADDAAWDAVREALDAPYEGSSATCVSDVRFDGVSVRMLMDEDSAAEGDDKVFYLFLADRTTMTDPSYPLLAVDLSDEPGRTIRVPVEWYPDISTNLSICNMDFADFADSADGSSTFRGFGDG
ncbi:hypothetical protein [Streptomyces sp. NPDC048560]|uniref:DUF6924 domain-containing protein n=1 Tax=Streptomyces sp. NPDC048560 TaxID=3155488 RepID=UPI003422DD6E